MNNNFKFIEIIHRIFNELINIDSDNIIRYN